MKNVVTLVLGGGRGTRLYPLTKFRSKPAVPVAGKYRLIDIPLSNCINSGLNRIYVLTQFNSVSLHRHIRSTYSFDRFSRGFVEILAAQQTLASADWYQGTADAVRQNLRYVEQPGVDCVLVLSGDQLYRMDFRHILRAHRESGAEITLATLPVQRPDAPALGIMQIDADHRVRRFVEKPREAALLDSLVLPRDWYPRLGLQDEHDLLLASMGIYVFNRDVLVEMLDNNLTDFGKHVIPAAIDTRQVRAYVFQGYWEDIGTIRAFFEAHLDMTVELPRFSFFDPAAPVFTHPRWLPGSKINGGVIDHALLSDGCIINGATIKHSVIGIRSHIGAGSTISRTVMMGCDYYESLQPPPAGAPRLGIGRNARIENAIIDKNARIGNDVVISPQGKLESIDHPLYYIRDGIVIVPKNAVIPDGTVL
jgi:glucose-1-phosphate adenylyltransferase